MFENFGFGRGLLPSFGRIEVGDDEAAREVILLDENADAELAAAVHRGARVEARVTERIGGRSVTRALLVESLREAAA